MGISSLWQELEGVLPPLRAGYRSKQNLHVEQKPDSTLLSEADVAVQAQIIECVRAFDPDALIVAEESSHSQSVDVMVTGGSAGRWYCQKLAVSAAASTTGGKPGAGCVAGKSCCSINQVHTV